MQKNAMTISARSSTNACFGITTHRIGALTVACTLTKQ